MPVRYCGIGAVPSSGSLQDAKNQIEKNVAVMRAGLELRGRPRLGCFSEARSFCGGAENR